MKMFKRIAVIASFSLFLMGCSDGKQAARIHAAIKESATFENEFTSNQEKLYEVKEEAQLLYTELLNLTIDDEGNLNETLIKAKKLIDKQQGILDESEESFENAYEKESTIEEYVEKIKDEQQKSQASTLLEAIEDRKKLIDSYIEMYKESLEAQHAFYDEFQEAHLDLDGMDAKIIEINQFSEEMEEMIEQFNQSTEEYIQMKNEYDQTASFSD